jgi:hypothetical protein
MLGSILLEPKIVHSDLQLAQKLVFDKCSFKYTSPIMEAESAEYSACVFELNNLSIRFRTAKITPTKNGQFVTLWKRSENGPIAPFEISDSIDLFVISVRLGNRFGQFVFPKSVLGKQGIVTTDKKEGKRAMRVYPPWDQASSKQAEKTQKWQLEYFLEIPENKSLDLERSIKLYT